MNRTAQFKYWIFGAGLAVAVYLVIFSIWGNSMFALGLALGAACIGAFSLGAIWDAARDAETAATWRKKQRDEEARQAYVKVAGDGSKMLDAPAQGSIPSTNPYVIPGDEERAKNRDEG